MTAGGIDGDRVRTAVAAALPPPRDDHGRITLAVDVSNWLRPDAPTRDDRCFCHVYARGRGQAQMIPGWPYSFVAALEPGRTSWTALPDARRLHRDDDLTTVTAEQVRDLVVRLHRLGHHRDGDPEILIVFDAGTGSGQPFTAQAPTVYVTFSLRIFKLGRRGTTAAQEVSM
ncbi:transposase [Nocardia sp. SYP-A9097]|uniref:transposase n=1 Tax=Nocardia sp. SYP-A9097 TaxID=2663237 RepID=UPI001E360BA1|nr:transposase [Nocardia sp. SYP-A9097]